MVMPKYKPIKKDRLFFNRYQYCLSFVIDEATALRDMSHEAIVDTMIRRRQWREIYSTRWTQLHGLKSGVPKTIKEIKDKTVRDLHTLCDFFINESTLHKVVCNSNVVYVYSNDTKFLNRLSQIECLEDRQYTQAVVNRDPNTIILKSSQYQARSYFKTTKLTVEQKDHLRQFLAQQDVRIGPALSKWLSISFQRTQDYFFIDHHGSSWLTMLALVQPGLIRKTVQIRVG
jgi:hypothetical protein